MTEINGFDFDGTLISCLDIITPRDVVITGRCIDEAYVVNDFMNRHGLNNAVFFNPILLKDRGNHSEKARTISANHKANVIRDLLDNGVIINDFYEDDKLQADLVRLTGTNIIMVNNKGEVEL